MLAARPVESRKIAGGFGILLDNLNDPDQIERNPGYPHDGLLCAMCANNGFHCKALRSRQFKQVCGSAPVVTSHTSHRLQTLGIDSSTIV